MKRILIATASVLTLLATSLGAWAAPASQGASCTGAGGYNIPSGTCIVSPQSGCGYGAGADINALLEGLKSSNCPTNTAQGAQNGFQVPFCGASPQSASGSCNSKGTYASADSAGETTAAPVSQTAAPKSSAKPAATAQASAKPTADETANTPEPSAAPASAAPAESAVPADCGGDACTAGSACAQAGCTTDAAQCETSTCTAGANTRSVRSLLDYFISLLGKCGIKANLFCLNVPVPSAPAGQQDDGGAPQTETPAPAPADGGAETTAPSPWDNGTETPAPAPDADSLTFEEQVAVLVNEQRAAYGLSPLTFSTALSDVARAKSQDMRDRGYFDHTSPAYGTPFDMLKTFGISYRSAGENIAMGYASPETVVSAWMNSSGHRANILNASYTQIGVGYVASGNYWTQLFIG